MSGGATSTNEGSDKKKTCLLGSEEFGVRRWDRRSDPGSGLGAVPFAECAGRKSDAAAPAMLNRFRFPSQLHLLRRPAPWKVLQGALAVCPVPCDPSLLWRPPALSWLLIHPSGPWGSHSRSLHGTFHPFTSTPGDPGGPVRRGLPLFKHTSFSATQYWEKDRSVRQRWYHIHCFVLLIFTNSFWPRLSWWRKQCISRLPPGLSRTSPTPTGKPLEGPAVTPASLGYGGGIRAPHHSSVCLSLRSCLSAVRPLLFLLCLCTLLLCELLQVLSAWTLETLVLCAVYTSLLFWNSNVTAPAKCQPVAALPPQDSQFPKGDGDTVHARVMLSSAWPVRNIWKSFCKLTLHYATHSFHSIVGFWAWSVLLCAHLHLTCFLVL